MSADPTQRTVTANGVELCVFERNPDRRGADVSLLFLHATGFHARIWDQIILRLPAVHSIAVDLRGHGRSQKVPIPHWAEVVADVAGCVEALDLTNVVGVGHSMGGHALLGAAAREPARYRAALAVDPVIAPPEVYESAEIDISAAESHPMARRRARFDSPEDMLERLLGKGSYGLFERAMLEDYCEYGLLEAPEGGYTLACPPAIEASVYMTSRSNGGIHDAVRSLEIPVRVLRAKLPAPGEAMDFSSSPTWPGLVDQMRNAEEQFYPQRTHFLPMEIPDEVAGHILRLMAQASDGE